MSLILLYIARSTIRTRIKVVCCLRILPIGLSIIRGYYVSMNSAGITFSTRIHKSTAQVEAGSAGTG